MLSFHMVFTFDTFELDVPRMELRHDGKPVHLEPKHFELLRFLVTHADRVVSKDEIFDEVWPGVFVTEASLSGAIKHVRKALGDDGDTQRLIRTIRGKGFRFVGAPSGAGPTEPAKVSSDTAAINAPRSTAPIVAVLPFELSGVDHQQTAISEAIPTEIIAGLSKLGGIKVIARGTSFKLDRATHNLSDIRARLGVTYTVAGYVEMPGRQLRVVVELTDTRSGHLVWSETYQTSLEDVFIIREKIVTGVVLALEHRVPLNEAAHLSGIPTEHLDAWGLYHLGVRHLYRFNQSDNASAAEYFRKATVLDPTFARAIAGLSYTEFENYNLGFGSERAEHLQNAMLFAEQSVDLDPFDPFCSLVLGRAHWIHEDIDGARAWTDRAIELNPNYAFGHYNSGKFAAIACQSDEADAHLRSSLTLSPMDPHLQSMLSARAFAAFNGGHATEAIRFADHSLRAPNAHLYVCIIAAAIFAHYGETEKKERALARIKKLGGWLGRDHFHMLFEPSDPTKARELVEAIDQLGL